MAVVQADTLDADRHDGCEELLHHGGRVAGTVLAVGIALQHDGAAVVTDDAVLDEVEVVEKADDLHGACALIAAGGRGGNRRLEKNTGSFPDEDERGSVAES